GKVVIEFVVEACTNRVSCRCQKKSIPICRRSYGRFRAYCATCASPMLYDELLAEALRQPLTYEACEKVIRAAGCISNNDAHRPRWIGLRESDARHSRQRGSARGQMQKISAGKFHFEPPFTSLDHLVGAQEECLGNLQSEQPGSGQVDSEVELRWLFDWKVGRVCAAQNLGDILGRASEQVGGVCSIGHQASRFDVLP